MTRVSEPLFTSPRGSPTGGHDPSTMHEARHRPIRCNPRYLHTVRRVAPYSGGHVVEVTPRERDQCFQPAGRQVGQNDIAAVRADDPLSRG